MTFFDTFLSASVLRIATYIDRVATKLGSVTAVME